MKSHHVDRILNRFALAQVISDVSDGISVPHLHAWLEDGAAWKTPVLTGCKKTGSEALHHSFLSHKQAGHIARYRKTVPREVPEADSRLQQATRVAAFDGRVIAELRLSQPLDIEKW
jgi:hypothetical protein